MHKKILSLFSISILLLLMLPAAVFAQGPANCSNGTAATDPGFWITCIINRIVTIVVWPVFITAVVIMFILAGFKFLTAQGEPTKIIEARKTLIWAVVGVVVGVVAFSAYATIQAILGIT